MSGEIAVTSTVTLADNTIVTVGLLRELVDGIIAEILPGAIGSREIAPGSISEDKLDSEVRSQLGIPDASVTLTKIADGALSADAEGRAKMANEFLIAALIASATITADRLSPDIVWPVGVVLENSSEVCPAGFFHCDGSAKSRSTYAALFAVVGTTFGQGDGSTTFNIPDTRGRFKRGWDAGCGRDPGASERTAPALGGASGDHVGSLQGDSVNAHTHTLKGYTTPVQGTGANQTVVSASGTGTVNTEASAGASETRPINQYFMDIIKY